MFRHCALYLNNASNVSGGPVGGLRSGMRSTIRPCLAEKVLQETSAIRRKLAALVDIDPSDDKPTYKPSLPREWVKAPLSRLSTSASRRDWFRLMQFNIMTDAWSVWPNVTLTTTPVHGVKAYVPGFTRPEAVVDAFYPYDPTIDKELPPFLQPNFKRAYLLNEILYYDPDIVCLNEVNRSFFDNVLWNYVRYHGYGTLYQSSRGHKVRALRKGDDPLAQRHNGKIEVFEDIGNVVLFHKGRFVPILMPGKDLVQHLHFAHIVSMRDKVTNMTLNVVCAQFTAGDSEEAAEIRLHEARQTLQILDAVNRNDTDRSHMSNVICGDFNNVSDEEPCVQLIRDRFFSTYDVVGGPRWTTWFHEDPRVSKGYSRYYACNRESFESSNKSMLAEREAKRYMRMRTFCSNTLNTSKAPKMPHIITEEAKPLQVDCDCGKNKDVEEENVLKNMRQDALATRKQSMKESGIIYRTQDFIFYDPATLALHQVLDVPEEIHINSQQLLPSSSHPSHHIHLVVDVSFNDVFPDVAEKSLKD